MHFKAALKIFFYFLTGPSGECNCTAKRKSEESCTKPEVSTDGKKSSESSDCVCKGTNEHSDISSSGEAFLIFKEIPCPWKLS